jgi:hypothetical protein
MEIVLMVIGALAGGILGGWIYAGFPLPRRAASPAGAESPAHVLQPTDA